MRDIKQLTEQAVEWIKTYAKETNMKGCVVGVSGGKDSSVVAALLCKAIGKENVFGVLMPNGKQADIDYSFDLCEHLGITFVRANIGDAYNSICDLSMIATPFTDKAKTNIAPRLRMTVLYAYAQTLGFRVAGTGNASEAYIGWCTKWGDMACDFNVLANITCSEVVEMGRYLGLPEHLWKKLPSDGLTNKSDEENFGFTYEELEIYMGGWELPENSDKMREMHLYSRHKFDKIPSFNPCCPTDAELGIGSMGNMFYTRFNTKN